MKKYLFLLAAPVMLLAEQPQSADPFEAMAHEMDAVMARLQEQMRAAERSGNAVNLSAEMSNVDLKTKADHYELSMAIPDASEKSIDIRSRNHIVTVSAKREEVRDENTSDHYRQERRISSFVRSVALPEDAETDRMKTKYDNGILTITIPKKS